MSDPNYKEQTPAKQVSWYQNIKWWVLLIISFVGAIFYGGGKGGGVIWYFVYLMGFIFAVKAALKENYFKAHPKDKWKAVVGFVIVFFLFSAFAQVIIGH